MQKDFEKGKTFLCNFRHFYQSKGEKIEHKKVKILTLP